MAVRPISACLWGGMLMPAMRAMVFLSALTLLVARVGADHADHALAPDHLAVAAHLLHGCSDFHVVLYFRSLVTWPGTRSARASGRMASARRSPCRRAGCGCSACA